MLITVAWYSCHALRSFCWMRGTDVSILHIISSNPRHNPMRYVLSPHFSDKDTKNQKCEVICRVRTTSKGWRWDLNPQHSKSHSTFHLVFLLCYNHSCHSPCSQLLPQWSLLYSQPCSGTVIEASYPETWKSCLLRIWPHVHLTRHQTQSTAC